MKQLRLEILADYGIPEDVPGPVLPLGHRARLPSAAPGQDHAA